MRPGVDDRDLAGLPVGDVDQDLRARTRVEHLLGLAEIQDALRAGQRGRGSGEGDLPTRPARDFGQGGADVARETPRARRRELGQEHEGEQAGEHHATEDEQGFAHVRGPGPDCRRR